MPWNYIEIDISKKRLDIYGPQTAHGSDCANTAEGINALLAVGAADEF